MEAPPRPPTAPERPRAPHVAILLLVAVPLLLYRIGAKDVWEASEGRPLESAREMREHGDYLVQYTNGEVDLTKPPLYAWATAGMLALTGGDSFEAMQAAGRLPSVLAAIAILLLAYRLAARAAGPRAGLLAALVLLTTAKFAWQARLAELETLLGLGVLLAYTGLSNALAAADGAGRWRAWALFHLGLGFAFAVKGPIALLLVVPGAIAATVVVRRRAPRPSVPAVATAPIALLVGLAWYVAVVVRDGRPALDTFLSYARGENVGHLRGPLYYLLQYPLFALPWTPAVLVGFALPWSRGAPPETRAAARFALAAFAATFVVLSCLGPKQTHYLIPIFPFGAVLAGLALDRWIGASVGRIRAFAGACAVVVAVFAYGLAHYLPGRNAEQSARGFMTRVAATVPPGAKLGWTVFGSHSDYLWYLPMRIVGRTGVPELVGADDAATVAKVRAFLAAPEARFAIVTSEQAAVLAPPATATHPDLVAVGDVAIVLEDVIQKKERHVALVSNVSLERKP